jgi:hypothetical protein
MTTVTLSWTDPEAAGDFLALRDDLRRDVGVFPDTAAERLRELVRDSDATLGGDEDAPA